ncbi:MULTISPECIES: PadR family transcriptional regulator [Algoriphagus]|uniref:PadR family transcriptional regulator n=1 Tax=Algoriphagus TaxID=246875 RepID=UPI002B3B30C0|nr:MULTISPECIES: PadR family transcriptional regulator [unclassified Algoriphagus]MEB2777684.1 PadR family transcriptional regulator [Algoriphagus sp. D3-2-R+10]MEB2784321.1 PadR family transcriptional regulator [Algoriphagus sp. E1-3-M2]
MKGYHLGELEELVLLTVGILDQEAYGVAVLEEIKNQTGRKVNISAIHTVLNRLEEKGFLKSYMGGATEERGGRRKRLFTLSATGRSAIEEVKNLRNKLFDQLPPLALDFSHGY